VIDTFVLGKQRGYVLDRFNDGSYLVTWLSGETTIVYKWRRVGNSSVAEVLA
jgi:hypothetical protein